MHEKRIWFRGSEELLVHLIGHHLFNPLLRLLLLTHADPNIGVNDISVFHGLKRVRRKRVDVSKSFFCRQRFDFRRWFKFCRTAQRDLHAKQTCSENPGICHVAGGIADERDFAPFQRTQQISTFGSPTLRHRKRIRVDLARVEKIRQGIDHRHRSRCRQSLDIGVIERAHDQSMHET